MTIGVYEVDSGFRDAMGLTLIAGRWFDDARPMDDMSLPYPPDEAAQKALAQRGGNIVINELAAKRLGFNDPSKAVGKTFGAALVENELGLVPATIIGVVKDSRFRSVKEPLDPIMFLEYAHRHSQPHDRPLPRRSGGGPRRGRAGMEARSRPMFRSAPNSARTESASFTRRKTRGRKSSPPSRCSR